MPKFPSQTCIEFIFFNYHFKSCQNLYKLTCIALAHIQFIPVPSPKTGTINIHLRALGRINSENEYETAQILAHRDSSMESAITAIMAGKHPLKTNA